MENGRKEFVGQVCNIYMILLLAGIPLYTRGSYYQVGDTKYLLFRNVALLCTGIWVIFSGIPALGAWILKIKNVLQTESMRIGKQNKVSVGRIRWSMVDSCMLVYGACAFLSAVMSSYRTTAWLGYREWYMGALSQLLFVGIYFMVSREYTGSACPVYIGEAALFLVTLIAFLQRFDLDILGLLESFQTTDWAYSHMVSTVGNINWLCGYLSVAIVFPVVGYLYSRHVWKTVIGYGISVTALVLLLTQGSDIGIVIAAACVGMGLLYGIRKREIFGRSMLLALGVCVLCPVMGWIMRLLDTLEMLPVDGFVTGIILKPFWWAAAVVFAVLYLLEQVMSDKAAKVVNRSLVTAGVLVVCTLAILYLCTLPEGAEWGSGRGGLWRAAWAAFCRMDLPRKLLGVGPDCFAEYIYNIPSVAGLIQMEGHWADSVFTNAHNEWLNLLVNEGIFGLTAYLGIFACAFRRYRNMPLGIMTLVLYGIGSLVSFQQVMNAPLLFLVLGICESRYRRNLEMELTQFKRGKEI